MKIFNFIAWIIGVLMPVLVWSSILISGGTLKPFVVWILLVAFLFYGSYTWLKK